METIIQRPASQDRVSRWRRLDIPQQTYDDLVRAAQAAHMSTQAYAARLLNQGMARDAALAEQPRRRP